MDCRNIFCLAVLSLAAALPTRIEVEKTNCKPMDLIFLLDTSRSIYYKDFNKQLQFVNQIIDDLAIGPGTNDTRVAVVTFADRYWPQFYLRTYSNKKKLQTRINFIRHKNGRRTDTGSAIKFMVGTMFREYVGGRANSSKIAIVITDGRSQNPMGTKKAALVAKNAGIQMFAIGVGHNVYEDELDDIGSDPIGNHVFLVETFAQLGSIKDMLPKSACEAIPKWGRHNTESTSVDGKISTTISAPNESSSPHAPEKLSTTTQSPENASTSTTASQYVSTTTYAPENVSTSTTGSQYVSTTTYAPENVSTSTTGSEYVSTTTQSPESSSTSTPASQHVSTTTLSSENVSTSTTTSQNVPTTTYAPQNSSNTTYAQKQSSTTKYAPEKSSIASVSTTGYILNGSSTTGYVPKNSSKVKYTPNVTPATRNDPKGSTVTESIPHKLSTSKYVSEISATQRYIPEFPNKKILKSMKENRKDPWNMINKKKVEFSDKLVNDRPIGGPQAIVFNDNPTDYCGEKDADIYFVLDSSSSIWPIDFNKQLEFVKDMIDEFDIDNTNGRIRIGVVVFSSFIKNVVALDSKRSKDELKRQVISIDYMSGRTNTSDAIKFVRKYGFRKGVARDSAVKIAIIMTDGISRNPSETAKESELARGENIHLFAVGIGNKVDKSELERIANDPDNKHVFHVSSFENLDLIKDILTMSACAVIPDQPSNIMACDPRSKAEIVFVYDAFALGFRKTQMIGNMVYEVVSRLNTSSGNIMVGRLTDNCPSSTNILLGSTKDPTKFAMFEFPGISRLLVSLQSTFTGLPGMKRLGVLIVDESTQGVNAAKMFMKGNTNFELMVIAIGDKQKLRFAEDLASEPNRIYLVNLEKYSSMTTAFSKILETLCGIIKPLPYPNLPLPA